MTTYTYPVLAFRQQVEAPLQVAFVAHAADVLAWAGVPRKSDELLTGFQRFRDPKRIDQDIAPFFMNERNCSPTAIIVALRREGGVGRCNLNVNEVRAGEVVNAELTIDVDDNALKSSAVFAAAQRFVATRLSAEALDITDSSDEGEDDDEEAEEGTDAPEDNGEAGDEDAAIHLGSVTLARMKTLVDDRSNWSNEQFQKAIADYVKPAFLIDGQHRVTAAARFGDRGLPFIVCGLFDAPWEEQVFQFTVVNLKPKKIPPGLIASIAGLSLTRSEQDRVEGRLSASGVKMDEVNIMSLVAYDGASPFAELVDMAVGGASEREGLLGYGSVKRIAKVWYRCSHSSLTQIAKRAFATNSTNEARREWRESRMWFRMFCKFWEELRGAYPSHLWEKRASNRLFIGAHLWALQEALLLAADGQLKSVWELSDELATLEQREEALSAKLLEVVSSTIIYFPVEMWLLEWKKASQDTTAGRTELVELFEKFIDQGKKSGKVWKGWRKDAWFASAQ